MEILRNTWKRLERISTKPTAALMQLKGAGILRPLKKGSSGGVCWRQFWFIWYLTRQWKPRTDETSLGHVEGWSPWQWSAQCHFGVAGALLHLWPTVATGNIVTKSGEIGGEIRTDMWQPSAVSSYQFAGLCIYQLGVQQNFRTISDGQTQCQMWWHECSGISCSMAYVHFPTPFWVHMGP